MIDLGAMDPDMICNIRPFGGFQIVLADPPWNFSGNSNARPGKNARRHYQCMSMEQICRVPVPALVARDALLLMWVTVPFAEHAMKVIRAWGFRYKSQLVWPKGRIGTGYYARNEHELVYIARRGMFPVERPAIFPTSVIPGRRREHSRKPEWVHDCLDSRFGEAPKLELFGRAQRPGWVVLGNDAEKFEVPGAN